MAAMLCYLESVDADTPPPPPPPHHTPVTGRSCALRSDVVVCSASSFVTPHDTPGTGSRVTLGIAPVKQLRFLLIRVGKCSNNGYKSVKPIILY